VKKKMMLVSLISVLVLLPLFASYAKPFYQGKTMTLIVATRPGGGYDYYGRMTAKYMQKYLPGSRIIVKNMPGAGHIIGTNALYVAKPDGLTIGAFARALIVVQVVGVKGVKFDLAKLSWIGSPSSDPRAFIAAKHTPYETIDEMVKSKKTVRLASSGVGTMDHMDGLLMARMLGAKNWKVIAGYGGGEGELAMMRGELDGASMSWGSARPFVEAGEARVLTFTSDKPVKGYERIPLLPNLVGNEYKALIDLMLFLVAFNRPYAGPPGMPADRLQILREAYKKAWHDPGLLKAMEKARRPVHYIGGEEALKLVKGALQQPPELVKLLKEAYGVKD